MFFPDEFPTIVSGCTCKERYRAMSRGEFLYSGQHDAWFFPDMRFRSMSVAALYFASERGIDDHSGQPYLWHCCPWCGADLPQPERLDDAPPFDENTNWR